MPLCKPNRFATLLFVVVFALNVAPALAPPTWVMLSFLTTLRLIIVAFPFFIGRFASYSFWVTTASAVRDQLDMDSVESASYVGAYFVVSQLLLVPAI